MKEVLDLGKSSISTVLLRTRRLDKCLDAQKERFQRLERSVEKGFFRVGKKPF